MNDHRRRPIGLSARVLLLAGMACSGGGGVPDPGVAPDTGVASDSAQAAADGQEPRRDQDPSPPLDSLLDPGDAPDSPDPGADPSPVDLTSEESLPSDPGKGDEGGMVDPADLLPVEPDATELPSDTVEDSGPADPDTAVIGPEPWVQCTDDAPCQAIFGQYAWCNLAFPGGQCTGCDPEAPGVHIKCTRLSRDPDITLSCRMANGGVCLYDCPCPPWLQCLESESLCVLRRCTKDSECTPFSCLEIGEPGSTRYCLPPR